MQLEIFQGAFRDQVKPLLKGWSIVVVLYSLALAATGRIFLQPQTLSQTGNLISLLKTITGQNPASITIIEWYNLAGFGLFLPVLLSLFSIWIGSRLAAAEGEKQVLALLMGYPISRRKIFAQKFVALLAGVFLLCLFFWVALEVFGLLGKLPVPIGELTLACLNSGLLALVFGTAAFMAGIFSGSIRKSRRIILAAMIIFYLFYRLPDLLPRAGFLHFLSPFNYALHPYTPDRLITGTSWVGCLLVLGMTILSWEGFEHHDFEI